jgi:hypothetical protein
VEYFVASDPTQFRVLPEEPKVPLSVYVGALGLAGESAVYAWKASLLLGISAVF